GREIRVHGGRFGPELQCDRSSDFHILGKWLRGIDKHVVTILNGALVTGSRFVVRSVAAERTAYGGHSICGVVGEFVRRLFTWWRGGKTSIAAQRIGRTT